MINQLYEERKKKSTMSKLYSEMSSVPPPRIFWPLLSLCIAIAAEIAATPVLLFIGPGLLSWNDALTILVAAALAALLVGLSGWWLFVVRPKHATIRRGILVGVLSSIIAHPLVWMSSSLVSAFTSPGLQQLPLPIALLLAVYGLGMDTFVSLILVGWFTTLIGGVAGFLLIYLQRALTHHWQRRGPFPKDDISWL